MRRREENDRNQFSILFREIEISIGKMKLFCYNI